MSNTPHIGRGPWKAYSKATYPAGPFALYFRSVLDTTINEARLATKEDATRTCALLNYAHQKATEDFKRRMRNALDLNPEQIQPPEDA